MTEILLIRHAEPLRSSSSSAERTQDPPLSAAGEQQARLVAAAVLNEDIHALYTSPLLRARQTADVIGRRAGLAAVVHEDLAEFDRGTAYVHAEDAPGYYESYIRGDMSAWGTTPEKFRSRCVDAIDIIAVRHPDQRVVVVSHGGVQNAFLGALIGVPRIHFFHAAYCSISRAQIMVGGTRALVSVNETAHLRPILGG